MSSREKHRQRKRQQREAKAKKVRERNRRERQIKDARMKAGKKAGGLVKTLDDALRLAYEQTMIEQRIAFKEKFGRDVEPDDPIFFDPDADEPVSLSRPKIKEHLEKKGRLDVYRKLAAAWQRAEREIAEKTERIRKEHAKERAKRALEKRRAEEQTEAECVHVDAPEG